LNFHRLLQRSRLAASQQNPAYSSGHCGTTLMLFMPRLARVGARGLRV
jgi:hypothetical protein